MSDRAEINEEDTRRLVVAITDFLRDQLVIRTDLVPEDRDCLEIAIQCLDMAYGLEGDRYLQYRFSRPLLDIFNQVTNPVTIRDKLAADAHKDEGNSYMTRNMFSNAEAEYTHAIELDQWNAIYYCNRASARIEQRNYFEAIADCRQALMLNPDYAKAHARMGQAYALVHRHREAARCFRQALELEPDNERYRNNLRVAESQINRPDAMGLITSLLATLFGITPGSTDNDGNTDSTINLPTSFMIITESSLPTRQRPPESTQSSERNLSTKAIRGSSAEANNFYPHPYQTVNEGTEEPILQIEIPFSDTTENDEFYDDDDMPDLIFFQDESPTPSPETDDGSEIAKSETEALQTQNSGGDLTQTAATSETSNLTNEEEHLEQKENIEKQPNETEIQPPNGIAVPDDYESVFTSGNLPSKTEDQSNETETKSTNAIAIPDDYESVFSSENLPSKTDDQLNDADISQVNYDTPETITLQKDNYEKRTEETGVNRESSFSKESASEGHRSQENSNGNQETTDTKPSKEKDTSNDSEGVSIDQNISNFTDELVKVRKSTSDPELSNTAHNNNKPTQNDGKPLTSNNIMPDTDSPKATKTDESPDNSVTDSEKINVSENNGNSKQNEKVMQIKPKTNETL